MKGEVVPASVDKNGDWAFLSFIHSDILSVMLSVFHARALYPATCEKQTTETTTMLFT